MDKALDRKHQWTVAAPLLCQILPEDYQFEQRCWTEHFLYHLTKDFVKKLNQRALDKAHTPRVSCHGDRLPRVALRLNSPVDDHFDQILQRDSTKRSDSRRLEGLVTLRQITI